MATVVDLPSYPTAASDAGEARWRQMLRKGYTNGVWPGVGGNLTVSATGTNGMTVSVGTGEGIVDGIWFELLTNPSIDIAAAPGGNLSRIDLIIVRLNTATPIKAQVRVLTGTASQSPVRPTPVPQTDIVLAQVAIGSTTTAIGSAAVTDTRTFARMPNQVTPISPALVNGWQTFQSNFDPVRYFKDGNGIVRLEGRVTGGTQGQAAFTLPLECWPLYPQYFPAFTGSGGSTLGAILVNATGQVIPATGSTTAVSLSQISFQANR